MKKTIQDLVARFREIDWRKQAGLFATILVVVVAYQQFGGAYHAEFGAHPDEAGHYVTGLMVRDYIAHGIPGHPMRFAEDYYDHYPKVALGNWPPFFYMMQSAWTLPFSASKTSIILFMAVLTALVALLLSNAVERDFGPAVAGFCVLLFLSLPLIQKYSALIMTEMPIALLAFISALFFANYLDREKWFDSIAFGLFASATILTKGSGLYLAFLPPLGVLLTRKWLLLKKASFWSSAVIVAVLTGPWTYFTLDKAKAGWDYGSPSLAFTLEAAPYYGRKLYLAVGFALAVLLVVGVWRCFILPARRGGISGKWAAMGSLFFCVVVLQPIVPCGQEARHLVMLLPPLMLFVAGGLSHLMGLLEAKGWSKWRAFATVAGVTLVLFVAETFRLKPKGSDGFAPAAQLVLGNPEFADSILFVSSDASGEGMFISEVAMHERRPGHIIRRASKVLAESTWSGGNYEAKVKTPEALLPVLDEEHIGVLVLDNSMREEKHMPHHDLLAQAVAEFPNRFTLLGQYDAHREGIVHPGAVRVFQLKLKPE